MNRQFDINGVRMEWMDPIPSIAVDDFPLIEDTPVGEEMAQHIYERWDVKKYGDLLDFGGGVFGISVAMVAESLSPEILHNDFGLGKENAELVYQVCKQMYDLEPWH